MWKAHGSKRRAVWSVLFSDGFCSNSQMLTAPPLMTDKNLNISMIKNSLGGKKLLGISVSLIPKVTPTSV